MEKEITIEEGKTTWMDVFRKYKPDITEDEANWILWNETCYPFGDDVTLKQIEYYFNSTKQTGTR